MRVLFACEYPQGFLQEIRPNSQFPADLVTFTPEILNENKTFFVQCLRPARY